LSADISGNAGLPGRTVGVTVPAVLSAAGSSFMTVTLHVTPDRALQPDPIAIRAAGFASGETVTLSSRLVDDLGVEWTAHGRFVADAAGTVDVAEAPSTGGTYEGIDAGGLIWSLRPASGADPAFMIGATEKAHKLGQPALDPLKPLLIHLSATGEGGSATTTLTLDRLDPGVEAVPVRDGRLRGIAFRWRDRTRSRGAIMSLTGSGGGIETGYAPILASQGYDVLSLAYFAEDDLPPMLSNIPLEFFREGFAWMRSSFGCDRVAVQGASRGGELALVLAAHCADDVAGAVAIVPMHVSSGGFDMETGAATASWTLDGQDIPYAEWSGPVDFEQMYDLAKSAPGGLAMTPAYREMLDRAEVRDRCAIPVERTKGPLLLISGVDDQLWPSAWGADMVIDRLRATGFAHGYTHLALAETGHWTPLPNSITTFMPSLFHSLMNIHLACGGTAAGAARNSHLTWNAMTSYYAALFAR
jgi:acyl-coenzyme A thioesterase 1/2/4